MKYSLSFMAIPATIIAAFLFINQKSANSYSNNADKPACLRIDAGYSFAPDTLRKDPICGMMADDEKKDTVHYKNMVFAFCSKHCKAEFVKDPEAYMPKKKD